MKRGAALFFLWVSFSPFHIYAQNQQATPAVLSLEDVLQLAKERNPDIAASLQGWNAMSAQIRPAKTWPDPTFSYVNEKIPSGMEGVEPETMNQYRVEQMIPFPGKLSADSKMKYHEARIAESKYRGKILEVIGDVRVRYYQLYLTDRSIDLARQSVDLMTNLLRTAQARVSAGPLNSA